MRGIFFKYVASHSWWWESGQSVETSHGFVDCFPLPANFSDFVFCISLLRHYFTTCLPKYNISWKTGKFSRYLWNLLSSWNAYFHIKVRTQVFRWRLSNMRYFFELLWISRNLLNVRKVKFPFLLTSVHLHSP